MVVLPARKVDLTGGIALHSGKRNVGAGPGEAQEFFKGAAFSRGGRTVFALPSRNLENKANIVISVEGYPNQFFQPGILRPRRNRIRGRLHDWADYPGTSPCPH